MEKIFISATNKYSTLDEHVSAPFFRRSFFVEGKPENAKISICGLGFYRLYINGENITKGHIAPYISNPDHICYYDVYDVTEKLIEGENVIGVILGNGFLNCLGGMIWDFDKAEFRASPMLALEFCCRTDSAEICFHADKMFLTHPSPITFDDLRLGESYDARLETENWCLPECDLTNWTEPVFVCPPRGALKECLAEPISVIKSISPISIAKEGDAFLYDFGVNSAGVSELCIKGEPGQKITLWHGENLVDGNFSNRSTRFVRKDAEFYDEYNQTVRYICGGKQETYSPFFHYSGFRYILVEGITEEQATSELLTFHVMSSDISTVGGFCCSDERINTLFEMVKNADRSNFFYFPTDCPHREKNGWTGDASMSADHMSLIFDTEASYREWLNNIRAAQNTEGVLPGIVPTAGWGFEWGNGPAWDSVLFNLPYVLYKYRGCTEVIKENAHAMIGYLEYILKRRSDDGTVAIGLGDWVPVGKRSSAYDAPLALTDSIMVMDMARKASEMLSAVGYTHQADFAEGIYKDMRETVRRELVDKDTMLVKGDCQSSQAISLYYGVFDDDEKERAFSHLLRQIHAKDDSFDCGFLGMHCIFHVLSDFHESQLAFDMITRKEYPSYTALIDNGQTALPEHFRPFDASYTESYNHHFLGDIGRWFMTRLAGLNIIDSKTVEIAPNPVDGIDFAEAYYDLPAGRISVRWSRNNDGSIHVDWTAPEEVSVKNSI